MFKKSKNHGKITKNSEIFLPIFPNFSMNFT